MSTGRTFAASTLATTLAIGLATAGAVALAPTASAKGLEARTSGSCPAAATWKLKASRTTPSLQLEYELDTNRAGQRLAGEPRRQRRRRLPGTFSDGRPERLLRQSVGSSPTAPAPTRPGLATNPPPAAACRGALTFPADVAHRSSTRNATHDAPTRLPPPPSSPSCPRPSAGRQQLLRGDGPGPRAPFSPGPSGPTPAVTAPAAATAEPRHDHGATAPADDVRAGHDHGGDRPRTTASRATTTAATARSGSRTTEPGDDHGGAAARRTAEPGDDHGGDRQRPVASRRGSDDSGSRRSRPDSSATRRLERIDHRPSAPRLDHSGGYRPRRLRPARAERRPPGDPPPPGRGGRGRRARTDRSAGWTTLADGPAPTPAGRCRRGAGCCSRSGVAPRGPRRSSWSAPRWPPAGSPSARPSTTPPHDERARRGRRPAGADGRARSTGHAAACASHRPRRARARARPVGRPGQAVDARRHACVYADEPALVGRTLRARAPSSARRSPTRRPRPRSPTSSRPENEFETGGRLLEVYRPVWTPSGRELLFEVYAPYDSVRPARRRPVARVRRRDRRAASCCCSCSSPRSSGACSTGSARPSRSARRCSRGPSTRPTRERRRIAGDPARRARSRTSPRRSLAVAGGRRGGTLGRAAAAGATTCEAAATVRASIRSLRSPARRHLPAEPRRRRVSPPPSPTSRVRSPGAASQVDVDVDDADEPACSASPRSRLVYRVAQECLRNVVRARRRPPRHGRRAALAPRATRRGRRARRRRRRGRASTRPRLAAGRRDTSACGCCADLAHRRRCACCRCAPRPGHGTPTGGSPFQQTEDR